MITCVFCHKDISEERGDCFLVNADSETAKGFTSRQDVLCSEECAREYVAELEDSGWININVEPPIY